MFYMLEKSSSLKSVIKKFKPVYLLFLFVAIFSMGYALGASGFKLQPSSKGSLAVNRTIPEEKDVDFSLFWRVWDTLEGYYFDQSKLDANTMTYGAIKGMVDSLGDPYTSFLTPRENEVIREDLQGSFEGVGIQIGYRGTQLVVVAPLPGTPAEKAGIRSGDYIIGIKDEARGIDKGTVGINLQQAVQDIRGPKGSKVTLALLREGSDQPMIIDVVREPINVPSVTLSYLSDDQSIAHVRILKFGAETVSEWDAVAIDLLKNSSLEGIILDVRNNTGGYMQAAIDIASDFLEAESVVVIEEKSDNERVEYESSSLPKFRQTPLVLLVNQGSASASEILAGALRDNRGIKLVGQTTFGKGTIQEPKEIEDGSGLHITIARWLTPKKYWVNDIGLEPDVIIEDNPDTVEDEELLKAAEVVSQQ